jgi:beta-lactamase regulating signal transducer with metallopeptidase domain
MMHDQFISSPGMCLFLVRTAVVTSIILLVTWLGVARCGGRSAATRHGIWFAAVLGCCLAPIFVVLLPAPIFVVSSATLEPAALMTVVLAQQPSAIPERSPRQERPPLAVGAGVAGLPELPPAHPIDAFDPARQPENSVKTFPPGKTPHPVNSASAAAPADWLAGRWHHFAERWGGLIVGAWLVVLIGLVIRLGLALVAARRLCRSSTPFGSETALATLAALRGEPEFSRPIDLKLSEAIDVPMLAGIVRPCLLLPKHAREWTAPRMRAVLRHELGHVVRHDLLSQVVADVAVAVWWFQPLLWHAARRLRIEREFACDDLVLESGASPCDYANELLAIAAHAAPHQPSSPVLVAMAGRTAVEQRIRAILDPALNRIAWSRRGMAAAALVVLLLLAVITPLTPTVLATGNSDGLPKVAAKQKGEDQRPENQKDEEKGADQKAATNDAAGGEEPAEDRLHGLVVDENEKPAAGVEVTLEAYGDEPQPVATSDAKGRFELRIAHNKWKSLTLTARANEGKLIGTLRLPGEEPALEESQLKITLAPAREIPVRVVDGTGQPVAGALAGVFAGHRDAAAAATNAQGTAMLLIPAGDEVQQVYAVKPGVGLDYRSFVLPRQSLGDRQAKKPEFPKEGITLTLDGVRPLQVTLSTTDGQPIRDAKAYVWLLQKPGEANELNLSFLTRRPQFRRQTNERGSLTFDWIPRWQEQPVTIWPQAKEFARERGSYDPRSGNGEVTLRLNRLVPIRGKVITPDGKPAAGILVSLVGAGNDHDDFREAIRSGADGTFEVLAAPNKVYLLIVQETRWAAVPVTGFALWPDQPVQNLEFRLRPSTRIHGRVTVGPDEKPVAGLRITSYQFGADAHNLPGVALPNPQNDNRWIQPTLFHHAKTGADGRYEFFVGPGNFDIRGPNQNKIEKFEIHDETEKTFDFHMTRPETGILKGLVVTGDSRTPVVGAKVHGIERWHFGGDFRATTDEHGRFEVERNLHPATIHAANADGSLAGLTEIDSDTRLMIITLKPVSNATGILLDEATNAPLADQELVVGVQVHMGDRNAPFRTEFGGTTRSDAQGRFRVERLVQGGNYRISRTLIAGQSWSQVETFTPDKPGDIDLGTIIVKPQRVYKPPTLAERITQAFTSNKTPLERFAAALPDAKLARLRILMLLADPDGHATTQFMKLRYEHESVRTAFNDFRLIAVNSAPGHSDDAKLLAERFGKHRQTGLSTFFVIVADADGNLVDTAEAGNLMDGGEISPEKLLLFLQKHTLSPLDAKVLYHEALEQAKRENKRVILQETATWCGPCWKLSRFLDTHRKIWEPDYLWIKMDHRWTGARELMKTLRGDATAGVPWWVIVDAEGKTLTTSNRPSGENIGFPSTAEAIQHFQTMFEQTAQRLSPEQIQSLVRELQPQK